MFGFAIGDTCRDLLPYVELKKREKNTYGRVLVSVKLQTLAGTICTFKKT